MLWKKKFEANEEGKRGRKCVEDSITKKQRGRHKSVHGVEYWSVVDQGRKGI